MTDDRPSLGTLVAGITSELGDLVQNQIELAKAEMRESAKAGAAAAALFIVAGALLAMVGLLTTWAVVYVLVEVAGLPQWASFLIVAGVYLVVAAILIAIGVFRAKQAKGPEQAKAEMQRTRQIVEAINPNTPPVPQAVRSPGDAQDSAQA
jgi:uncharacterized membrane protein YqjE